MWTASLTSSDSSALVRCASAAFAVFPHDEKVRSRPRRCAAASARRRISVLAFGEGHTGTVISHHKFGGWQIIGRQRHGDLSCIGIPRVRDQLGDGGDRALIHLDTERIDDAAMKGQMQFLSLIGIHGALLRYSASPVTLVPWLTGSSPPARFCK
jgi:hypothetical protein